MKTRSRDDLLAEVIEEFVELQGYVTVVVPGESVTKVDAESLRRVRRKLRPRRAADLRLVEAPEMQ